MERKEGRGGSINTNSYLFFGPRGGDGARSANCQRNQMSSDTSPALLHLHGI